MIKTLHDFSKKGHGEENSVFCFLIRKTGKGQGESKYQITVSLGTISMLQINSYMLISRKTYHYNAPLSYLTTADLNESVEG